MAGESVSSMTVGHIVESREDGTNLFGSKDGQQGYSRQIPIELKLV
jgi:hypothetical protein